MWLDPFPHLQEKADLGELNFSLCYLPTAGRLTVTIIKASNLKAMDLTGFSGGSEGGGTEGSGLLGLREKGPGGEKAGDPDPWGKAEEGSEVGSPGSVLSLPTPRPLREGLFDQ